MKLAIHIGNTNIYYGHYKDNNIHSHVYSREDFPKIFANNFTQVVISSAAPQKNQSIINEIKNRSGIEPYVLKLENIPMEVQYDTSLLGIDRVLACYGALKYKPPFVVFDFGTAITVNIVNSMSIFTGGIILPGLEMGLKALNQHTSLLPYVKNLEKLTFIGKNTAECITSGAVFGTAALTDGLISRLEKEINPGINPLKIIITGGGSDIILPYLEKKVIHDKNLVLEGILKTDIHNF